MRIFDTVFHTVILFMAVHHTAKYVVEDHIGNLVAGIVYALLFVILTRPRVAKPDET